MDDAEGTVEAAAGKRDGNERARGDFRQQGGKGQEGDAGILRDGAFDGFDIIELQNDIHVHVLIAQEVIDCAADDESAVKSDVVATAQADGWYAGHAGKGVCGGANEHYFFEAPGERFKLARAFGKRDDAEVGGAVEDAFVHFVGVQIVDVHLGAGVGEGKGGDVGVHVAQSDGINGGDLNGHGQIGGRAADGLLEVAITRDDVLAGLGEDASLIRAAEGADGAVDQLHAEVFFDLGDDLAHGRLRDLVGGGSLGKAAKARHIAKNLERLNIHDGTVSKNLMWCQLCNNDC